MTKYLYWLAPFYTLFILVMSLMDNAAPEVDIQNFDKVYHAMAYFVMALLWYLFFYSRYLIKQGAPDFDLKTIFKNWTRAVGIGAGILSLLIGILIEIGQEYIALNRTMDVMDVCANLAGIIFALLFLIIIDKLFNTHKIT